LYYEDEGKFLGQVTIMAWLPTCQSFVDRHRKIVLKPLSASDLGKEYPQHLSRKSRPNESLMIATSGTPKAVLQPVGELKWGDCDYQQKCLRNGYILNIEGKIEHSDNAETLYAVSCRHNDTIYFLVFSVDKEKIIVCHELLNRTQCPIIFDLDQTLLQSVVLKGIDVKISRRIQQLEKERRQIPKSQKAEKFQKKFAIQTLQRQRELLNKVEHSQECKPVIVQDGKVQGGNADGSEVDDRNANWRAKWVPADNKGGKLPMQVHFRPGLQSFLGALRKEDQSGHQRERFVCAVGSMGEVNYVKSVVRMFDPKGKQFPNHQIHSFQGQNSEKDITDVVNYPAEMVIVVDDRYDPCHDDLDEFDDLDDLADSEAPSSKFAAVHGDSAVWLPAQRDNVLSIPKWNARGCPAENCPFERERQESKQKKKTNEKLLECSMCNGCGDVMMVEDAYNDHFLNEKLRGQLLNIRSRYYSDFDRMRKIMRQTESDWFQGVPEVSDSRNATQPFAFEIPQITRAINAAYRHPPASWHAGVMSPPGSPMSPPASP